MFTLHRQKDIERQLDHFIEKKAKRSPYSANEFREYLLLFVKKAKKDTIFDIGKSDRLNYQNWIIERFHGSEYCRQRACQALDGFLRFYHCDII
jgi:hypothetical protein